MCCCSFKVRLTPSNNVKRTRAISVTRGAGHLLRDGLLNTEIKAIRPIESQPSYQSLKASTILVLYARYRRHLADRPKKVRLPVVWTTQREEYPQRIWMQKEILKNGCISENNIASSGIYGTNSTNINTKIDVQLQASSADFSLQSTELLAQVVMKVLRPRRIRFTIDPHLHLSSQDIRASTHPPLINRIAISKRTLNSTPQNFKGFKGAISDNKELSHLTVNSSNLKEVVSTISVFPGKYATDRCKTFEEDDNSRKESSEVSGISTLDGQ